VRSKLHIVVLSTLAAMLFGHAISIRVPAQKNGFFGDEATYYSMAYSWAFDGDTRYEAKDLERVYDRGYAGGPSGIFLVRNPQTGHLYHAKAFAYSLLAAPFVRLFGDNGFFLLHALLFTGIMFAGYAYLGRVLSPGLATLYVATYFLASITFLYHFWIAPEVFNMSLGFFATFLWLYKERPPGWPADAAWKPTDRLAGGWTDYAAVLLYGVAAYSKPPSVVLAAPILFWTLLQLRFKRAVALGVVLATVIVLLFGITYMSIGDWNYMQGDRRSFTGPYPFQYRDRPFDTIGTSMSTPVDDYEDRIPRLDHLAADLTAYLWVGRNGGVLIYMLPAVLAALAWLSTSPRRWMSPHALLLAATALSALAYITMIQDNWIGGGGTVGPRYFAGFYYAPFFAIPIGAGLLAPVAAWAIWALFLSQITLSPFASSFSPAMHTKAFPFKLLPPELGQLINLPFNTNPLARRVLLRESDPFDLFFLDDDTYLREDPLSGFWVKSRSQAEVVLRSSVPVSFVIFELQNGPVANQVRISLGGQADTINLQPHEQATVRLHASTRFSYVNSPVYRFVVGSKSGGVPMIHSAESMDYRHLGVFVSVDVEVD
jgi:hypothetical protein